MACDQPIEDVNECEEEIWEDGFLVPICGTWDHICTDLIGGYECSCPPGFEEVGWECVDVDECAVEAADYPCADGSICMNKLTCTADWCANSEAHSEDGYICVCPEGTTLDPMLGCIKPPVGACDLTEAFGYCMSYIGSFYTEEWVEQVCSQGVVLESCPTDDLLIKCRENEGTDPDLEVLMFYYTSIYGIEILGIANEQDAIDNCEAKGGTVE